MSATAQGAFSTLLRLVFLTPLQDAFSMPLHPWRPQGYSVGTLGSSSRLQARWPSMRLDA